MSGELVQTAIIAVALAIAAVLIYIWLRFEWQFSLGAVAALVHDVVLTIGIFSLLQIRFDLAIIAALLTIVGYSLNDTVVVFDRVRENLRKYKKRPLGEVLNLSINETLSRTVMTSVTTLIALISLFVLGGDVIRGFVFAMIWGVIVGTYSSVFVASVVLLRLGVTRDWSKSDNGCRPRAGRWNAVFQRGCLTSLPRRWRCRGWAGWPRSRCWPGSCAAFRASARRWSTCPSPARC